MGETITTRTTTPQRHTPAAQRGDSGHPATANGTANTRAAADSAPVSESTGELLQVKTSYTEQSYAGTEGTAQNFPTLTPPQTELTLDNIHRLQAFIMQTLSDANASQLKLQQQLKQGVASDHIADLVQAKEQLDAAQQNVRQALDDLRNQTQTLDQATRNLSSANAEIVTTQAQLDESLTTLAQLKSSGASGTDLAAQIQAAALAVESNQQRLLQAKTTQNSAQTQYDATCDAVVASEDAALSAQTQLVAVNDDAMQLVTNDTALLISTDSIQADMAALLQLMAELTQILNDTEKTKLQKSNNLTNELQTQRLKQCQEAADKYRADVQAAKEKNARASIANKILGGFLTVFGVVASLGSGPGGMAIAAIGVGMFIADTSMEACGVQSITSRWMTPLQEKVITPMTKWVAGELIRAAGDGKLSEKDADTIANVIVGVAMAGAMIAVTVVAHNNLSGIKLPMSQFNTQITNAVTAALEKIAISPVAFRVGVQVAMGVVTTLNLSVQTAMRIEAGKMEASGARNMADLNKLRNDQDVWQTMQTNWVQSFCKEDTAMRLWDGMSDIVQKLTSTSIRIAVSG